MTAGRRILLTTAVALTFSAMGCSSEPEAPPTFAMTGTITAPGGSKTASVSRPGRDGDPCETDDGYDDVNEGTTVSVYGADGRLVATGSVGPGKYEYFRRCILPFTVASVPGGPSDLYQVEVANRGRISTSGADAMAGKLGLTLGD
jgi:hypothetical protein